MDRSSLKGPVGHAGDKGCQNYGCGYLSVRDFQRQTIGIIDNPISVNGKESKVSIRGFDDKTLKIPGVLGKNFGIIYVVKGNPAGAEMNIHLRILHPLMKNPDTEEV